MRWSRPAALSTILVLWVFCFLAVSSAQTNEPKLDALVENGGYVITRNGRILAQLNNDKLFVPASTIKIATALMALELLGPDHRISTEFYLRDDSVLCIKGYGDPYLISERLQDIGADLRQRGLTEVKSIVLDDSFFALEGPTDGAEKSANPYDAENMALAVNFNSVVLSKQASGIIGSPEPQTPVLPLTRDVGALLDPGLHRVNVSSYTHRDATITSYRYVAELFAEQLRRQGIAVSNDYRRGQVRSSDKLVYIYRSELTVAEMIRGCLKYSNNFIANQLFLYCGAFRFGPPATWEKGRRVMAETLNETGLKRRDAVVVEGSGLSRKNRITPAAMITLLEHFRPHAPLLSMTRQTPLKSGTMTGVYGYAGYLGSTANLDPFVVLLNQETNTRNQFLKLGLAFYQRETQLNQSQ